MTEETKQQGKWILTVDWCSQGKRGLLSDKEGGVFWKNDTPHTWDEIWDIVDCFAFVLAPESKFILEEDFAKYHLWISLAEFEHEYGYIMKDKEA